jgi:chemotaxis receptor (MCP) glutamine deamidase CheD
MSKILAENLGGKFLRKILAENFCGKFRRKILAENLGGKFGRKILAKNLGASQNLGRYPEFGRLVKIQVYDRAMADVEISAPR